MTLKMEDVAPPLPSQRFQVKISGSWHDYGSKEDEVLKVAFDNFIRKTNEKILNPHNSAGFKELVIKGRRYVVDFHKMVQVRKDNKKDYKVRPPPGSSVTDESDDGPREQGHLKLACEQCKASYTLRCVTSRSEEGDWADSRWCQDCWRPFLDKEEKKVDKNQKQRQAVQQPCRMSSTDFKKAEPHHLEGATAEEEQATQRTPHCAYCDQPIHDAQPVYLGGFDERCELCHGDGKCADAVQIAKDYYDKLRCKDLSPVSMMKRSITEEYQRQSQDYNLGKKVCIPPEITAF